MPKKLMMTKAGYAKYRGVHRATVSGWHDRSWIVLVGGRVDVRASDAMLKQRPQRYRGGKTGNDDTEAQAVAVQWLRENGAPFTLAEAQRVKENLIARQRAVELEQQEIELARTKGTVIDVAEAQITFQRCAERVRASALAVASDTTPKLIGQDGPTIYRVLTDRMRAMLEHLSTLGNENDDDEAKNNDRPAA
jgi:hypothetical protein